MQWVHCVDIKPSTITDYGLSLGVDIKPSTITDYDLSFGVDIKPLTITDCDLSFKHDSNQDNANPETPEVLSSRLNRMAWSRVSKAALRSNSAAIDKKSLIRLYKETFKVCKQTVEFRVSCLRKDETAVEKELPSSVSSKRMGDLRLVCNFLNHSHQVPVSSVWASQKPALTQMEQCWWTKKHCIDE